MTFTTTSDIIILTVNRTPFAYCQKINKYKGSTCNKQGRKGQKQMTKTQKQLQAKKQQDQMQRLAQIQSKMHKASESKQAQRKQAKTVSKQSSTNKASKHTNAKPFDTLLRNYEQAYINQSKDLATHLEALANACACSVLRKCIKVSGSKAMETLRKDLLKDRNNLLNIERIQTATSGLYFNASGDLVQDTDTETQQQVHDLLKQSIGDGYDLVNDAILLILEETDKAKQRNGGQLTPLFLETPYTQRQLKRKVYIQVADSVNGWETVETTPIQQSYRGVRRAIESTRAVQVAQNGYTYIDDLATDPETDTDIIIYRRFGKYADIGGAVVDFNGKEIAYTTDKQTANDFYTILENLNLTARQMQVIQYRLKGYGQKAIATALGVRNSVTYRTLQQIQHKATLLGYIPTARQIDKWKENETEKVQAINTTPTPIIIPKGYHTAKEWAKIKAKQQAQHQH